MTKKVWFRSSEGTKVEDRGTLTVDGGKFRFEGRKGEIGGTPLAVEVKPHGFTNWVHARYESGGEIGEAYFVCSAFLGWSGILGANKQLAAAIEAQISPQA